MNKLKSTGTFLIILMLLNCSKIDERLYGKWCINDDFHSACYEIKDSEGKIIGEVVSYFDGTSRYRKDSINPKYIFTDLKYKNGEFTDGISGETSSNEKTKNITIKVRHNDTLEVKTHIKKDHTLSEIWIRKVE